MADESLIRKALNLAKQGQEFVFPHASKDPLKPMAYVKDFNEFFAPAAQMALDEAQGEEEYPAWAYALASVPFIGKPAKAVAKVAGKGGKVAGKAAKKAGGKKESWQVTLDDVQKLKDHSARMNEMDELFELGESITPEQFARYNAIREAEGMPARDMKSFMDEWDKAYGEASPNGLWLRKNL